LTSTIDGGEGGVRLAMLASAAAMLGVALAVPGAFGGDTVLFGAAYLRVRLLAVSGNLPQGWQSTRGVAGGREHERGVRRSVLELRHGAEALVRRHPAGAR
jgi:hypothetical protein